MTNEDNENGNNNTRSTKGRQRSTQYPRFSLKEVEALAREVLDQGVRHVHQENVATAIGYSGVRNGSYKGIRAAGRYFGVVDYEGDEFISLDREWAQALTDGGDKLKRIRKEAAMEPELYQKLAEKYNDKQLPSPDRLTSELFINPEYGIRKDVASKAAETFRETVEFAGLVDRNGFLRADIETDKEDDELEVGDSHKGWGGSEDEPGSLFPFGAEDPFKSTKSSPTKVEQSGKTDEEERSGPRPYRVRLELDDCTLLLEVRSPLPRATKEVLKAAVEAAPERERGVD